MNRRKLLGFSALILASTMFGTGSAVAAESNAGMPPDILVLKMTGEVIDAIKKNPSLAKSGIGINKLVDKNILPYTDFETMTRMAVGPQWRKASPAEREEIIKEFRALLIAVYSGALKEAADYNVEPGKNNFNDQEKTVIVRTRLTASGRDPIQLDYRLLRKDDDWKIFDVNVGGVWLVENYRSQFATVINQSGIQGLIKQLKDRVAELEKGK